MALTHSFDIPLGHEMPMFRVVDVTTGRDVTRNDVLGPTLVAFICQHCPYVKHIEGCFAQVANLYSARGAQVIAISSNDPEYDQDDSPEALSRMVQRLRFTFPLCFDESQEAAEAFRAVCTPDFYVFDRDLRLAYHGEFDESRIGNSICVSGTSIRAALDWVIGSGPMPQLQKPSVGCSIKWRVGREPVYFKSHLRATD